MQHRPSTWTHLASVVLFVVGLNLGVTSPDLDQRLPLLLHRSLLTHGVIIPLLLFMALRRVSNPIPRLFAIGFCLASTVHLCFDLFPRAWRGFALIWIPFYGRATPTFSWLWMGLGCVVCLYLALLLIRHALEVLLGAARLASTFAAHHVGERVGPSLLALVVALGIALALPSRAKHLVRCKEIKTDHEVAENSNPVYGKKTKTKANVSLNS